MRLRLREDLDSQKDLLVHAGPGAGKTLGALLSFKAMQREGSLDKFLVFCHRTSIISQWKKASEKLGLTLKDLDSQLKCDPFSSDVDGWILTYQGASRNLKMIKEEFQDIREKSFMVIADEVHHLGLNPDEPEKLGPVWGRAFLEISKISKLRIGLTGTPFRADNLPFCSARKISIENEEGENFVQIRPDLCVEPYELIEVGDVRPLQFHFLDGSIEHASRSETFKSEVSLLSEETRESWRSRNLRRAIRLSESSKIALFILLKAKKRLSKIKIEHGNAAGLVIASDIDHAELIASYLREDGEKVELIHSQENDTVNRLAEFQSSKANWLVSVDMCSEGFDAPRLRVVAYLTTVVTRSRFIQCITRAVRLSSDRVNSEPIPRHPSHIYAPADPLLMDYAKSWTKERPYFIKGKESLLLSEGIDSNTNRLCLPMEAIRDHPGKAFNFGSIELPRFIRN